MGEAKRRGSFKERQTLAVQRKAEAVIQRQIEAAAREADMTPEQRRRRSEGLIMIAALISMGWLGPNGSGMQPRRCGQ